MSAYEIIENRSIDDLNSKGVLYRHIKTGAHVATIKNDDDNKVFYIGFRTPPVDSTGSAHIVEHTVLCGSDKYPVKDPFVELCKGSLNTFLNAMTFPDKTVYPVASCNDADFRNLMDVYLDAVFHPNIYKEEKIFKQEGWHYELNDKDDELTLNGVVYSEMKGAFSNPDDIIERQILNALYPDNCYGFESGGDPDQIPSLSYEKFLDFHRRYYHPSNSYIYLYGNMDMEAQLEYIDREYLSKYDELKVDSEIKSQPGFESVKEITIDYPIMENEDTENNTYFSLAYSVGDSIDRELYIALSILDYALCSNPGAPLRKALIDAGIGDDVYTSVENAIKQPIFAIMAKGANAEDAGKFRTIIKEELEKIVQNGFDKKTLMAALNNEEFRYKEADFGNYPKGLVYGLTVLDSWLYDDTKAFWHIEANATFAQLKEKVETNYFENLVKKYFLDNNHGVFITAVPRKGLVSINENNLKEELARKKASMTAEEVDIIVRDTKELKEYQEREDAPENLAKIPLLKREDMKREARPFKNELCKLGDTDCLVHDIFTNGIGYFTMTFDVSDVPFELLKYMGVLKACLLFMDTQKYTYGQLCDEISFYTGGIFMGFDVKMRKNGDVYSAFTVRTKALYENMDKAIELCDEVLYHTVFDRKRLREILAELESKYQSLCLSSGHSVAISRATSYISSASAISQECSGISFYENIRKWNKNFDKYADEITDKMGRLLKCILRKDRLMYSYISPKGEYMKLENATKTFEKSLYTEDTRREKPELQLTRKNEGFKSASQVQYVARVGNYRNHGFEYTGVLRVLKVIMGYDYLWNNVRVKGGAYGCMFHFNQKGIMGIVSYRDPNLKATMDIYERIGEYLKNFDADERKMTQYIIGALSDLDMPLTPSSEGSRSYDAYIDGTEFEEVQKYRNQLLDATVEDIRGLAPMLEAVLSDNCICVVGSESAIEENRDMFGTVCELS